MKEVAQAAGVSLGAVSQALNDTGRLKPETRERIRRIAREMGYRPNPLVAALASKRFRQERSGATLPIAYLYRHGTDPFTRRKDFPTIHLSESEAADMGYSLHPHELPEDDRMAAHLGKTLLARGYAGVILAQCYGLNVLPRFPWSQFPVVAKGNQNLNAPFYRVSKDWFRDVCSAWDTCAQRGYKRIGAAFFSAAPIHPDDRSRLAATLYSQQHYAKELPAVPYFYGAREDLNGFHQWVSQNKPDVVLLFPFIAAQFEQEGHRIPEDFALVHFTARDTTPYDRRFTGFTTTEVRETRLALERLDWQIRHRILGPVQFPVETSVSSLWQEGETLPVLGPAKASLQAMPLIQPAPTLHPLEHPAQVLDS